MFDNLRNMTNIAGLLKDLPRLKERVEQIKAQLGEMTVVGESGGGAVRVTANGMLKVVSVEVDQAMLVGLVDPDRGEDRAMAEDLIAGAVNAALTKARELAEEQMHKAAGEMGLPLPPGGLGGLMR